MLDFKGIEIGIFMGLEKGLDFFREGFGIWVGGDVFVGVEE